MIRTRWFLDDADQSPHLDRRMTNDLVSHPRDPARLIPRRCGSGLLVFAISLGPLLCSSCGASAAPPPENPFDEEPEQSGSPAAPVDQHPPAPTPTVAAEDAPAEMISLSSEPVSSAPTVRPGRRAGIIAAPHSVILSALRDRVPSITGCYEGAIGSDTPPSALLEVTLRVLPTGVVEAEVRGDDEDSGIARCIEARLSEIRFAPEELDTDGIIEIRWPFNIDPRF